MHIAQIQSILSWCALYYLAHHSHTTYRGVLQLGEARVSTGSIAGLSLVVVHLFAQQVPESLVGLLLLTPVHLLHALLQQ